jgi:hypothetical protein
MTRTLRESMTSGALMSQELRQAAMVQAQKSTGSHLPSLDLTPRTLSIRPREYRCPLPAEVVERVHSEFVEMRGFSPTLAQAARLFDLPAEDCDLIFGRLVQDGFLRRTPDGRYHLQA